MIVRARHSLSIVALAGIWLTMLLCGGGPLDRQIYEALYAGHRPMLAGIARVLTFLGEPTVLIGISRVMLGVHWPSDVIGGWAFGMLWVLLTLRLSERLFRA